MTPLAIYVAFHTKNYAEVDVKIFLVCSILLDIFTLSLKFARICMLKRKILQWGIDF